jgi:acyl dehydratase/NAD(P)-dependent dehydrogenase (short-subunit alcohol dehydrogenase family)
VSRIFSLEDQAAFAALSGDYNPIHVDALLARRLLFGMPVVHGVHLLLWALESCPRLGRGTARLASVSAVFRQPVRGGESATCEWEPGTEPSARVTSQGRVAAEIKCRIDDGRESSAGSSAASFAWPPPQRGPCEALDFAQATSAEGEAPLVYSPEEMASRFPRLSSALPAWQLAVLLAVSRLVGMNCPGLRSLLSSVTLTFGDPETAPSALGYRVLKSDPRLSSLRLRVAGPGLDGEVGVLLRPDPVDQPSASRLAALVQRGEFAGMRALVVGGSRGLGEVAAKLVAAGGGDVRLTYQVGAVDAARVVDEVRAAGGKAGAFACDVLERRADAGLLDGWAPTHLLYFPTPFISLNESTEFQVDLFRSYCRYYVEGFVWILEAVAARTPAGLRVLYPSSAVLDQTLPKAAEYAAAKAAGEAVCAQLSGGPDGLRCHAPRLPRMLTDRTTSVLPADVADVGLVMLGELRRLSAD